MQICKYCNKNSSEVPFRRAGRICDICETDNRKKPKSRKKLSSYEKSTTWLNSTVKYNALELANSSVEDARFVLNECMGKLQGIYKLLSDDDKSSLKSSIDKLRDDLGVILLLKEDDEDGC